MKPAVGTYRLSTPGPNGSTLAWDVAVTATGATGPFNEQFDFDPNDVLVTKPGGRNLTIECNGAGSGTATFGTPTQTVTFPCVKIA